MKRLWGIGQLDKQEHLPEILRETITVVSHDKISYIEREDAKSEDKEVVVFARTMKGLLFEHLGSNLGARVFSDIKARDAELKWGCRGPQILRRVLGFDFSSGGVSSNLSPGFLENLDKPDIVFLQEYDSEELQEADFGNGEASSFRCAIENAGYDSLVFLKPDGKPFVATFWRKDRFCVASGALEPGGGRTVSTGTGALSGSIFCDDLFSKWHPWEKDRTSFRKSELLKEKQRRSVGMVKLRSKQDPQLALWAVNTHLMTDSRDCNLTNAYPGEVRAGELAEMKRLIHSRCAVGQPQPVVIAGDFNTQPTSMDIFQGSVQASKEALATGLAVPSKLNLDTGFCDKDEDKYLDWVSNGGLVEAFATKHRWDGKHAKNWPTSISSKRSEHIDYIFYTPGLLSLKALALRSISPRDKMPNAEEPSDHLPLGAIFDFTKQSGSGSAL